MADQPAKYLEENIGAVLSRGLAEMAVSQPKDGVEFLSSWLKIYAEQEEAKGLREREGRLLVEEREKTRKIQDAAEAKRAMREAEKKSLEQLYSSLITKLSDETTEFEDATWDEMVEVVQTWSGVKAVYLGTVDEEIPEGAEGPVIQYEFASAGSESMKDQCLPFGKGVTLGAVEAFEAMPDNEAAKEKCLWRPKEELEWVDPPEDMENPPVKPCLKYYPVNVPCVTDVEKMNYFQMTRLGAYLAVPMVYSSYYTEEALEAAKAFEKEKKVDDANKEAAEKAKAEAIEKGEEPPAEEPPAEGAEPKVMVLPPKAIRTVLCLDTLGTNAKIPQARIPQLLELCKAAAECKARTETAKIDAQALQIIDEEARTQQQEEINEITKAAEEALKTDLDTEMNAADGSVAEDAEVEEKKELVRTKYVYMQAMQVTVKAMDKILAMKSWVYMNPKVASVVCATILMYSAGTKFDKDTVYPKRKTAPSWTKMKELLDETFFKAAETTEVDGPRKGMSPEQKLKYLKETLANTGFDDATSKEVCPAFGVLFAMIQASVNYRSADVAYRKATYNKAKAKAAEEEGAAVPSPTPAETCEDCVEE